MSEIKEAITAAALAAGVKPQAALEQLESKALVNRREDGTHEVLVRAGGGAVASVATAVEGLVPAAVRTQSAQDRATYAHVTGRKAARATPEVPQAPPLDTAAYQSWRKAKRLQA